MNPTISSVGYGGTLERSRPVGFQDPAVETKINTFSLFINHLAVVYQLEVNFAEFDIGNKKGRKRN